jgi:cyanophycinase
MTNGDGIAIMAKPGYVILQGGAEFGGQMKASDMRAVELAGGLQTPICIITAAAAPDSNHGRAGDNGRRWFSSLGAKNVSVAGVIDQSTANDTKISAQLRQSRLIYMLGGFPAYLADTLKDTPCWHAMLAAFNNGAVLGGSSAGAMALCEYLFDPIQKKVIQGLGLLPGSCILPHHDTFGRHWASQLQKDLPQATLIGIDERTGMINEGPHGCWNVYGKGGVTVYRNQQLERYKAGAGFHI